jgi:hypothetical protein
VKDIEIYVYEDAEHDKVSASGAQLVKKFPAFFGT